jgi:hypothetical protein
MVGRQGLEPSHPPIGAKVTGRKGGNKVATTDYLYSLQPGQRNVPSHKSMYSILHLGHVFQLLGSQWFIKYLMVAPMKRQETIRATCCIGTP